MARKLFNGRRTAAVLVVALWSAQLVSAATTSRHKTATKRQDSSSSAAQTTDSSTNAPASATTTHRHALSFWHPGFYNVAPQGSLAGTPGLWNTQFAETLAPGAFSVGVYGNRYTREPGGMVITDVNSGLAVGITKRLEFSWDSIGYRRVRTTSPEQLSFARGAGFTSFNEDVPFPRGFLTTGPANMQLALTYNLLSQERGAPFGLAVQGFVNVPYFQDYGEVVNHFGVDTGEYSFGDNVLVDKWMGSAGIIAANIGYRHINAADAGGRLYIPFRDEILWSYGVEFPRQSRLQGIVELNGEVPFGAGAHPDMFGPTSPVDSTWGIRLSPVSWMGLNAGYRLADNAKYGTSSGFVVGLSFGTPEAPPAPPVPPTLTCQADQATVEPGTTVNVTATASPAGTYSYFWTTTGGKLTPNQAQAQLDTTNLAPGMYTVAVRADNGQGGFADCKTNVEVREKPKNPPTVTCTADPTTVKPGAAVTLTAQASSPDNRPLTYAWTTTAGQLDTNNQATAHLDTTGVAPGTVTATVTVTDDRNLSAQCSSTVTVQAPPPAPTASLGTTIRFKRRSARVDNAAKAALDDIALRLQQDPNARAVVVGSGSTTRLAKERAINTKAYLTREKGVSADRIELRYQTGQGRNAEVWIVPQGASYTGSAQTFTPVTRRVRRRYVRHHVVRHHAARHHAKKSGATTTSTTTTTTTTTK